MRSSTGIRLKGITVNNPALAKRVNYKDVLASSVACVGAWRFDVDELVVEDATGISKILNWKTGGVPLDLLTSANGKATRMDSSSGVIGKVANFPLAASYRATGLTWSANQPYTLLVIVKPDNYVSQMAVAGSKVGATAANARIETLTGAGKKLIRHVRGAVLPAVEVTEPLKFVAFYASYGGSTDTNTRSQILSGAVVKIADAAVATESLTFDVGSAYAGEQFQGQVDFIGLFNKDLSTDAAFKAIVDKYMSIRTGVE